MVGKVDVSDAVLAVLTIVVLNAQLFETVLEKFDKPKLQLVAGRCVVLKTVLVNVILHRCDLWNA